VGSHRRENKLLAYNPLEVKPGEPIKARATLLGGKGKSVVPAVQQYVAIRGLPALPKLAPDRETLLRTLAGGWLDSKLVEEGTFRHAVWGSKFKAKPAADACTFMLRLAQDVKDDALRKRLEAGLAAALGKLKPGDQFSGVGHVRDLAGPLVWGHVAQNFARRAKSAEKTLKQFNAEGGRPYKGRFLRGHWSNEASGHAARGVNLFHAAALVSADPKLIEEALRLTRAMRKFDHGVPRGAQTWELSLHTPDVYGAGQLVYAYLTAYELSGEEAFLERAKYWGWTGVPFVYLRNRARGPGGLYATIPVFGATGWGGKLWIGLPVQWCGLVYADALYRLHDYDPKGPWLKLAQGITITGAWHTWPLSDKGRQGLLPDFYYLDRGRRDGPAINPGTLQANLPGLLGELPTHRFRRLKKSGIIVHVPGRVTIERDEANVATVKVEAWPKQPFHVALCGVSGKPSVKVDGSGLGQEKAQYDAESKLLVLKLEKSGKVSLSW
jgi:hypothetical protein